MSILTIRLKWCVVVSKMEMATVEETGSDYPKGTGPYLYGGQRQAGR